MTDFLGKDLLIHNETGRRIYNEWAKDMPIFDYHCHLDPKEIYEDKVFKDIGEIMLSGDHYKWRLMRAAGIDEELITGNRSYREKFIAYAKALEKACGNPLFVWTNMELQRYFGVDRTLTEENAARIYDEVNEKISDGSCTARSLITGSGVYLAATTDDPADELEYHRKLAQDESFKPKIVPTFRPDNILNISKPGYRDYIEKLSKSAGKNIEDLEDLLEVLKIRMDHFGKLGCRISDHALVEIPNITCDKEIAGHIFSSVLKEKKDISNEVADEFTGFLMRFLADEYLARDWTMQIHLYALRNPNSEMFSRLGPDSGFDCIGDAPKVGEGLCTLLDAMNKITGLPRTIVYTLNPNAYEEIAGALGSFTRISPGRVQLGAAWWLCDHENGIRRQLAAFAESGILGLFNGMLTDSRSFLSYVRHDYFRRILCSFVGEIVESGQYPSDERLLRELIEGICFNNVKKYIGI